MIKARKREVALRHCERHSIALEYYTADPSSWRDPRESPEANHFFIAAYLLLVSEGHAVCSPFMVFCFIFYNTWHVGILVPQPRIQPTSPAVEAWSLNRWTTREVLAQDLNLYPQPSGPSPGFFLGGSDLSCGIQAGAEPTPHRRFCTFGWLQGIWKKKCNLLFPIFLSSILVSWYTPAIINRACRYNTASLYIFDCVMNLSHSTHGFQYDLLYLFHSVFNVPVKALPNYLKMKK